MAKLKDLLVTIGLSKKGLIKLNADLRSTKANFKRNFGDISGMVQNVGRNLTVGLTAPLGIMAAASVKAFDQQTKAIAQVEAGLASTGSAVGYTSEQLQNMARDLQNKSLFGDEVILKDATAQLLTFTNIAGDNFERTQAVALDLATRLDGDLKSASIQLGKALNDPVANLTALSRAGIQFSSDQKAVIKSLAEGGELAQAQTIILAELEKQYGGSAEAAAAAGMGPFKQIQNSIGDITEEFGRLINDFIKPLLPRIQALVTTLTNLSDRQKKVAMTAGLIAAAAGPMALLVSGMIKARAAMLALNVVMAANPLGAVVAGTMLLVGALATLKASQKTTREETERFILRTKELDKEQQILALNTKRRALEANLAALQTAKAAEEAATQVGALGDKFEKNIARGNVSRFGSQIEDTAAAIIDLKKATAEAQFGGGDTGLSVLPTPTAEQVANTEALAETVKVDMLPAMQTAKELQGTMASDIMAAALATHELKGGFKQVTESVNGMHHAFAAAIKDGLPNFFMSAFDSIQSGMASFKEFMMQTLSGLLKKALALAAAFAVLAMLTGGATGVAELMGGKAGFGNFMKAGFGIPQMAEGGLFSGASLAMVGEGPGTSLSNPEVVAPLDKLQSMMGGGNVNVTGRLDGRDILISSERSNIDRNRIRGF